MKLSIRSGPRFAVVSFGVVNFGVLVALVPDILRASAPPDRPTPP